MRTSVLLLGAALALVACQPADSGAEAPAGTGGAEPVPASRAATVPADAVTYLRTTVGEGEGTYNAAAVDLDGDGTDEVVGYVMGPMWCGSGGCPVLVLARAGEGWRVVTQTSVTQAPVRGLDTTSHGWGDLSVGVSGGGAEGAQVRLTFDGTTYPDNPTLEGLETVAPDVGTELIPVGPGQPLP
ncbi:MAG TPA: hypothetical protein PLE81_08210 [Brevundimonas sp.]|jgi:hypothetical protein|uniref:hypothetical protein n=1 Tax=Brevundimonas sp. TaxID=1871086 RepID=UPI002BCFCB7E|nr:hypothetical protein [Brevundimonas sp.]HRH20605.1 hypothetical protein [Brevundimonas sp.]